MYDQQASYQGKNYEPLYLHFHHGKLAVNPPLAPVDVVDSFLDLVEDERVNLPLCAKRRKHRLFYSLLRYWRRGWEDFFGVPYPNFFVFDACQMLRILCSVECSH